MKYVAAGALARVALVSCLCGLAAQARVLGQEVQAILPAASLSGQARMSFWGLDVYDASLWVSTGFVGAAYEQSAFALELVYLRDFKGADIAKRSIAEMQRQAALPAELQTRWEMQMRTLFPDVKAGDRITGVNQPGSGVHFWCNGRLRGEIRDPAFAKYFFGIWLAPQTSEPELRQALLTPANGQVSGGARP